MMLLLALLGCGSVSEGQNVGDCTNRADDDVDGLFDCEDEGCANSPDCDTESDADADSDSDTDTDADSDADSDADGDADPPDRWSGEHDLIDAGVLLTGERETDQAGLAVAGADFNSDGVGDILVGAMYNDEGAYDAGTAYLLLGPISAGSLANADAIYVGESAQMRSARLVDSADMDGDGQPEVLVCALGPNTNDDTGVFYAASASASGEFDLGGASGRWAGTRGGDDTCVALSSAGDVNGDGAEEALVGAPLSNLSRPYGGAVFLFSGLAQGDTDDASARIVGAAEGDACGASLRDAGDFNGDGLGDVAIGCMGTTHPDSGTTVGSVELFFGPLSGTIASNTADRRVYGHDGTSLLGERPDALGAGDINGDGQQDLVVGLYDNIVAGARVGTTYVFYGDNLSAPLDAFYADATINGPDESHSVGSAVSVHDADGDGNADVLVGDRQYPRYASDSGAVWLVYGPVSGNHEVGDLAAAVFYGDLDTRLAGWNHDWVMDATGDGINDWIIGVHAANSDTGGVVLLPVGL